jgi:hypothetical protein
MDRMEGIDERGVLMPWVYERVKDALNERIERGDRKVGVDSLAADVGLDEWPVRYALLDLSLWGQMVRRYPGEGRWFRLVANR